MGDVGSTAVHAVSLTRSQLEISRHPLILLVVPTALTLCLLLLLTFLHFCLFGQKMGNIHSLSTESALRPCLTGAVPHVAFPDELFYQLRDAQPWNLNIPVLPAAVTYPETSDQVAAVIRCAAENDFKVQANSGGHRYGNYGA